mmetsp:Transcript_74814/g.219212  ORF Transcript_74814/g.219212 Transcript_74814/m.219212 type:complete len:341 (-) Transcript_74814:89-1111(-)
MTRFGGTDAGSTVPLNKLTTNSRIEPCSRNASEILSCDQYKSLMGSVDGFSPCLLALASLGPASRGSSSAEHRPPAEPPTPSAFRASSSAAGRAPCMKIKRARSLTDSYSAPMMCQRGSLHEACSTERSRPSPRLPNLATCLASTSARKRWSDVSFDTSGRGTADWASSACVTASTWPNSRARSALTKRSTLARNRATTPEMQRRPLLRSMVSCASLQAPFVSSSLSLDARRSANDAMSSTRRVLDDLPRPLSSDLPSPLFRVTLLLLLLPQRWRLLAFLLLLLLLLPLRWLASLAAPRSRWSSSRSGRLPRSAFPGPWPTGGSTGSTFTRTVLPQRNVG